MRRAERFGYTEADATLGEASLLPQLPIILQHGDRSATVSGLLDTGATVSVLPYDLGVELGAVWEEQTIPLRLTGNRARYEARALIVSAVVGRFAPVRLAFAWSRADSVPLILGQVNFFLEFDVCFYRSRRTFELRPKAGQ
jgi:hypothetical protein